MALVSSMRAARISAAAFPLVLAALPLGSEPMPPTEAPPPPHAVDVWLGHADHVGVDQAFLLAARQPPLLGLDTAKPVPQVAAAKGLAEGFQVVGNVAVL